MNRGILYGLCAYGLWGLFPIYWKWLAEVPALELLAHRVAWSFLLLIGVLAVRGRIAALGATLSWRVLRPYLLAAALIGVNWLIYVWSVNTGHIVEASLGYFINPLVSMLLGVLFLRERLRHGQWMAVGLALAGVFVLAFAFGRPPWIALALAASFGVYGLVKKLAPLSSMEGLTVEIGALFLPALLGLAVGAGTGLGALGHRGLATDALLVGAGVVTTTPLLFFSAAARRVPLATLGFLQFLSPTVSFLLGVLLFHERFGPIHGLGFGVVWVALAVFFLESRVAARVGSRSS